jgi:3'-5' exoribonuclease
MRSQYLSQVQPGDTISDVVVVSNTQLAASTTGKMYIKGFVSDRTAQLTARIWNATREMFASLPDNAFVRIRGRVENYQNNLQVIIEEFAPAEPGTFEVADLLPTTTHDIDAMCQRLFAILGTIRHPETKLLVQEFLDDEALMNDFARAPAASSFHHAFIGGLLEHTLNMLEVADRLIPLYPGTSRDLVLTGIFLHDIAKTWELSYDTAFNYTNGGQLVGHVVKAAMWIEDKARLAGERRGEPLPRMLIDTLQHLVLSHHGLPEHGASRVPMTPEAVFIHAVDNLDAKMAMSLAATRSSPAPGAENAWWTEFLKPFNTRFFLGDPTAAERPAVPEAVQPASVPPKAPERTAAGPVAPAETRTARPADRKDKPVEKPVLSNPLFDLGSAKKR